MEDLEINAEYDPVVIKDDGSRYVSERDALTYLLKTGYCYPHPANRLTIELNTNDVLAWGVADAIDMSYDMIKPVFWAAYDNGTLGVIAWVCINDYKMQPQQEWIDVLKKANMWTDELENLETNPTN